MTLSAGVVELEVRPDMKNFGSQVATGVTSSASGIGATLKKSFSGIGGQMATGLLGGFAALQVGKAVVGFVGDSISAASDLNESMTKVGVVFQDSSDQIVSWSETSAEAMGISQQAALEAAGTYGNLFDSLGIVDSAGAEMSTTLVGLASDLASFNNASPEEVLLALRSGLVGEVEPLRKFGVNLSAARIEQEALNEGLFDGVGKISDSAKAQAAYAIILKDTTNAQGDFARTSSGLANQQRIWSASLTDAKAAIGTQLLPALNELMPVLIELAKNVLPLVATGMKGVVDGMGPFVDILVQAAEVLDGKFLPSMDNFNDRVESAGTFLKLINNPFGDFISTMEKATGSTEDNSAAIRGWAQDIADGTLSQDDLHSALQRNGLASTDLEQRTMDTVYAMGRAEMAAGLEGDAISSLADDHYNAAKAAREQHNAELALVDPVFAVIEAVNQDNDAEKELRDARADLAKLTAAGKQGTNEYAAAQRRVNDAALAAAEAQAGLLGAVDSLKHSVDNGTVSEKDAEAALRDMAHSAGLTKAETDKLVAKLREGKGALDTWNDTPLDSKAATLAFKQIMTTVDASQGAPWPGGWDDNPATPYPAARGGIFPARPGGTVVRVGEAGRAEAIIPLGAGSSPSSPIHFVIDDWRNGLGHLESELDWNAAAGR